VIVERRAEKIWKRTVVHLAIVFAVGVAILASFVIERIRTSSGPTYGEIEIGFASLSAACAGFYLIGNLIKIGTVRWWAKED
jgi:hypothetical protein